MTDSVDLKSIINDTLYVKVTDENKSVDWEELAIESFDLVDLLLEIKEQLGITFSPEELKKIRTFEELEALVATKISE